MLKVFLIFNCVFLIFSYILFYIENKVTNSKETKFTKWWRNNIVGEDPYKK